MAHVRRYLSMQPCRYCGTGFTPRADLQKTGRGHFCSIKCANLSRQSDQKATNDQLRHWYLHDRLTIQQIARRLHWGQNRARRQMQAAKIMSRRGGYRQSKGYLVKGNVYIHRQIAQAMKGQVIHHIDGDKQNNRPENLWPMTKITHGRAHRSLELLAFQLVRKGLVKFQDDTYICSSQLERWLKDV